MRTSHFIDRQDDAYPLTDAREVREARRIMADADCLDEAEAYGTWESYAAERDRELWGDAPFEES